MQVSRGHELCCGEPQDLALSSLPCRSVQNLMQLTLQSATQSKRQQATFGPDNRTLEPNEHRS